MTDARSGATRRTLTAAVVARDGLVCGLCRGPIDPTLGGFDPRALSLGHRISRAHGGSDAIDNLEPQHRRCNRSLGSRDVQARATIVAPIPIE